MFNPLRKLSSISLRRRERRDANVKKWRISDNAKSLTNNAPAVYWNRRQPAERRTGQAIGRLPPQTGREKTSSLYYVACRACSVTKEKKPQSILFTILD